MKTFFGALITLILSGCSWINPPAQVPAPAEPIVEALDLDSIELLKCVIQREWGCTTTQARVIRARVVAAKEAIQ